MGGIYIYIYIFGTWLYFELGQVLHAFGKLKYLNTIFFYLSTILRRRQHPSNNWPTFRIEVGNCFVSLRPFPSSTDPFWQMENPYPPSFSSFRIKKPFPDSFSPRKPKVNLRGIEVSRPAPQNLSSPLCWWLDSLRPRHPFRSCHYQELPWPFVADGVPKQSTWASLPFCSLQTSLARQFLRI
jgi:hypothetical protein